jgi:phage-related protein
MQGLGTGVYELKESDAASWYRVIYLAKIENVIHVLHCFRKTSRKTDRRDLKVAAERLAKVRQRLEERRKRARQNHE